MRFIYLPLVAIAKAFGYNPEAEVAAKPRADLDLAEQQLAHARIEMLNADADAEQKSAMAAMYRIRIERLGEYIEAGKPLPAQLEGQPWDRPGKLLRGEKGDTGPMGPQGPQGERGPAGYSAPGNPQPVPDSDAIAASLSPIVTR